MEIGGAQILHDSHVEKHVRYKKAVPLNIIPWYIHCHMIEHLLNNIYRLLKYDPINGINSYIPNFGKHFSLTPRINPLP